MKKSIVAVGILCLSLSLNANMFNPIDGYGEMTFHQKFISVMFDKVILPSFIIAGTYQAGVDFINIREENKHQMAVDTVREYYSRFSGGDKYIYVEKEKFKKLPNEIYKHIECIYVIICLEGEVIIFEKDECLHKKYKGIFY